MSYKKRISEFSPYLKMKTRFPRIYHIKGRAMTELTHVILRTRVGSKMFRISKILKSTTVFLKWSMAQLPRGSSCPSLPYLIPKFAFFANIHVYFTYKIVKT